MNLLQLLDSWYQDPQKGGKGQGKKPSEFDLVEILRGIVVELEHTKDENEALAIVLDHLTEDGAYYTKLLSVHPEAPKVEMPQNVDMFGIPA